MKTELLQIRLSQKDKEMLKILSAESEMSMSEYIVSLIRQKAQERSQGGKQNG